MLLMFTSLRQCKQGQKTDNCRSGTKGFGSADERDKEIVVLKSVLTEKYGVGFSEYENDYIAVNECGSGGQLLMISSGCDEDGKHIVIFTILDKKQAADATAEIGLDKKSLVRGGKAL